MSSNLSYSHKDVWRIAAPMILSNLTVPLLGIVDTAVMGHLKHAHFMGSVAIATIVFTFLYNGFNFLRFSSTGFSAHALGRNNPEEIRSVLGRGLICALILGVTFIIFTDPIGRLSVFVIDGSAAVKQGAKTYMDIRMWSAPAVLSTMVLTGWLLGQQNARAALMVTFTANAINILLDFLFVVRFNMTVDGVAYASVCAEYLAFALGLLFVTIELRKRIGGWNLSAICDVVQIRNFFTINANLFVRTLSLMFVFAFMTRQGARQGELVLAANAVLLHLQHLLSYALDGLAHAVEALVGKSIGSRDNEGFGRAVQTVFKWSILVAGLFSAAFLLFGNELIALITSIEKVQITTKAYLPWLILSPLISIWSFIYDGIYAGALRAKEMRNTMAFSTFAVFLPAWFAFRHLGNHGLWLAFTLFMAARGITMAFILERWKKEL